MNYGAAIESDAVTNYDAVPVPSPSTSNSWFPLHSPLEAIMLTSIILNSMAGGIIFIFSNTIMPSLATFDTEIGVKVMNKINVVIVNPLFVIAFFGGLISAYPTAVMLARPEEYSNPARYYALAATLVFFFGEFMVTVTQNVPRNDKLVEVDPNSEDGVQYWENNYLKGWVAWNTARCVFSVISAFLGGLSLLSMRKL
eukprot:CAMPEP_0183731488 /NCGR_PEP_ID=MMETSP0737-20130205/35553_1 /TAXON_ID=385413 /ORGANISM="Thalassiosira miniscula, Strain CCMP1093" /LENGTH=197 /DNA_ID=CAMNT_0025964225 /DNA_START=364 /DNA_END=957 /DNA_ORIENTATION=+